MGLFPGVLKRAFQPPKPTTFTILHPSPVFCFSAVMLPTSQDHWPLYPPDFCLKHDLSLKYLNSTIYDPRRNLSFLSISLVSLRTPPGVLTHKCTHYIPICVWFSLSRSLPQFELYRNTSTLAHISGNLPRISLDLSIDQYRLFYYFDILGINLCSWKLDGFS